MRKNASVESEKKRFSTLPQFYKSRNDTYMIRWHAGVDVLSASQDVCLHTMKPLLRPLLRGDVAAAVVVELEEENVSASGNDFAMPVALRKTIQEIINGSWYDYIYFLITFLFYLKYRSYLLVVKKIDLQDGTYQKH